MFVHAHEVHYKCAGITSEFKVEGAYCVRRTRSTIEQIETLQKAVYTLAGWWPSNFNYLVQCAASFALRRAQSGPLFRRPGEALFLCP